MTEPTPQELAKDAINLLIGATEAGRWSAATFAAQDGIIAAFVDAAALTAALDANREIAKQKDSAYSQRDRLVAALSKQFPSYLSRHIGEWEEDWRNIVYVNLPTGQASWHIHDSELPWFSHLQAFGPEWDGHSDEEKHRRIEALPTGVSLRAELAEAKARISELEGQQDDFVNAAEESELREREAKESAVEHLAVMGGIMLRERGGLADAQAGVERLRGLLERAVPHITNSMSNPRNNDDWYRKGKQLRADIAALAVAATPETEQAP